MTDNQILKEEQRTLIARSGVVELASGASYIEAVKQQYPDDEPRRYWLDNDCVLWSDFAAGDVFEADVRVTQFQGRDGKPKRSLHLGKVKKVAQDKKAQDKKTNAEPPSDDRQRSIMFQSALKCVCELRRNDNPTVAEVVAQAVEVVVRYELTNWAKVIAEVAAEKFDGTPDDIDPTHEAIMADLPDDDIPF